MLAKGFLTTALALTLLLALAAILGCSTAPEATAITNNSDDDSAPAWSPDGRQIAFLSGFAGEREIYVMNADGSDVTLLTDNFSYASDLAWSPDGRQIAFVNDKYSLDDDSEIYVIEVPP